MGVQAPGWESSHLGGKSLRGPWPHATRHLLPTSYVGEGWDRSTGGTLSESAPPTMSQGRLPGSCCGPQYATNEKHCQAQEIGVGTGPRTGDCHHPRSHWKPAYNDTGSLTRIIVVERASRWPQIDHQPTRPPAPSAWLTANRPPMSTRAPDSSRERDKAAARCATTGVAKARRVPPPTRTLAFFRGFASPVAGKACRAPLHHRGGQLSGRR